MIAEVRRVKVGVERLGREVGVEGEVSKMSEVHKKMGVYRGEYGEGRFV